MTKKVKSSKKKFVPVIFKAPYMNIVYGLFDNRENLDAVLKANKVPGYLFNTELHGYAATYVQSYMNMEAGVNKRMTFVYAENMLNDDSVDEPYKLSVIAHEAYHIVSAMIEFMGDKEPSEEFVAYTLSQVTNDLFTEYFRWKEANSG